MRIQSQSQWQAGQLAAVPGAWVGRVNALHAKKCAESLRDGNLWLLDLSERMRAIRVPVNASDAEIVELSIQCAKFAMGLADGMPATMEAARARMARYVARYGIEPPEAVRLNRKGERVGIEDGPAVRRMTDPLWWRTRLRKAQARAIEGGAINLGYVHRNGEIYASDATVERRGQQKRRNAAVLEGTEAVNLDTGESLSLLEIAERAVSNPAIRRGELMTRIRGFEEVAKGLGHQAEFVTLTCPSRFHAQKVGAGGTAMPNHKHDGSTPRDAQGYLVKLWAQIRAKLKRLQAAIYGFRIAEPHHDGTPHWHMLFFMPGAVVERVREVITDYALRDSPDEPGARSNRVKFVDIDPAKGTAAGYIAKYVSKNIDGYQVQADFEGEDLSAVTAAPRVEAWASTWGIRQFQQIGGPPVGVWRELRRIREADEEHGPDMEAARAAADAGNWRRYVEVMGGPLVERKALPLAVARSRAGERMTAGEPSPAPLTRYGEIAPGQVFGVVEVCRGRWFVSRFHRWEIRRNSVSGGLGFRGSRTRVNNCTEVSGGNEKRHAVTVGNDQGGECFQQAARVGEVRRDAAGSSGQSGGCHCHGSGGGQQAENHEKGGVTWQRSARSHV